MKRKRESSVAGGDARWKRLKLARGSPLVGVRWFSALFFIFSW